MATSKNDDTPKVSSTYKYWSTAEIRYLYQHRCDGAESIAHALGRSVESIKQQAKRHNMSLAQSLGASLCPMCSTYTIAKHSAAAKHGVCIVCWNRIKADRRRQAEAEMQSARDYEREKKAAQRRSNANQAVPKVRETVPDWAKKLPEV
jgi:RNase P subunit RPR2